MKKAKDELKNINNIEGKDLKITRREEIDPNTGAPTGDYEITFSLLGIPVDVNGERIERYKFSPSVEKINETTLKNDYPDIYSGLATIWTYMLNKLKTREGL